jgi:hypothetical protein
MIFFYIIKSCQIIENNLISQQKNNCNGDRQLQSSNLQNKATSTPYKPQPIKFCRQTHSHYKFQTVKIWFFFGLQNWNWLKVRRVWLCKDGYRLFFLHIFTSGSKTSLYKARIHLCWKKKGQFSINVRAWDPSFVEKSACTKLACFGSPSSWLCKGYCQGDH